MRERERERMRGREREGYFDNNEYIKHPHTDQADPDKIDWRARGGWLVVLVQSTEQIMTSLSHRCEKVLRIFGLVCLGPYSVYHGGVGGVLVRPVRSNKRPGQGIHREKALHFRQKDPYKALDRGQKDLYFRNKLGDSCNKCMK